jgi:leader peptidase (prepilin peptidase) / N-methyltransferase
MLFEISGAFQQVWVFLVGSCLGSFFNVVIHRLPAEESITHPGSRCPECRRPIRYYDNIPLLSYLILRGRCRYCRAPISLRYPIVEAISGCLALFLFRQYGWQAQFFIELFFVSILVIVTFIDLDIYIIPDIFSLSGIVAGLIFSFFTPRLTWMDSLIGILLGGGLFYLIAVGYQYLRRQDGLGGGDIKLMGMIGAFLGWPGVVFTVLLASVLGTVVGLVVMWRTRKGMKTMLPFGPFLSFGAVSYIFFGPDFFRWYFGNVLMIY